jgi:hypothetical protein
MSARVSSRGRDLAERLKEGRDLAGRALAAGARDLPVLRGVSPKCVFTDPQENVLAEAGQILARGGRVYVHGDTVALEVTAGPAPRLVPLVQDTDVRPAAASLLANIFVCEVAEDGKAPVQFAPPRALVGLVLNSWAVRPTLRTVKAYVTRPVFDRDYNLLGPGWHAEPGVLVHGPAVEPVLPPDPAPGLSFRDRLPQHLRVLLGGFCFREAADAANALAALVTAMLINHFVAVPKPVVLLDGNQPGLGKTLLARVLGAVQDGRDPDLIPFTTDDDELGKRICATLRGGGQSVLVFDNAKVRAGEAVNSRVVESQSMAPVIALRILGTSSNFTRPNDVTWCVTMNDTKISDDGMSRGLPVRLFYEGDPGRRVFPGPDPVAYALEHRVAILGELAGIVIRWKQQGCPGGTRPHRCEGWARIVGGILASAGYPEFLGNLDEVAASFSQGLDDLAALAEAAVSSGGAAVVTAADGDGTAAPPALGLQVGLPAKEWGDLFTSAGVLAEKLESARSDKGKHTRIGDFLTRNLNRTVAIEANGRSGRARLQFIPAGKKQRRYFFIVGWEKEEAQGPGPEARPAGAEPPPGPAQVAAPVAALAQAGEGNTEDWS